MTGTRSSRSPGRWPPEAASSV